MGEEKSSDYKALFFRLFLLFFILLLTIPGIAFVDSHANINHEYLTDINVEDSENSLQLSTNDDNNIRIEYEIKLRLPLEQFDDVWDWMHVRYKDVSWLIDEGYIFTGEFGDEDFTDTYFDTSDLMLLTENNGVRHRMRTVHSGPASEKDGRQLIQIKLDRADATGAARSEIKFNVSLGDDRNGANDSHPLVGLVKRNEVGKFKTTFYTRNIDPYKLKPVLTLNQNRRRIYLSDQNGAFATLTLDLVSTKSWGTNSKWAELELELNEIRYTEANFELQQKMERVIEKIQDDIQQVFPAIVPNQTPKYNTAFTSIEKESWLPLRQVIRWGFSADTYSVLSIVFIIILFSGFFYLGRLLWLRTKRRRYDN
ncbi:CYTH domain-containing protein [Mariniphaga sp.]|uniref:CYTH domain-containing protein n=1 Tax=Mariniphaga sp. TaxID=1954475 RepID=UPI00356361D6